MVLKVVNKFNCNNFFKDFWYGTQKGNWSVVIKKVFYTPFMYWYYPAEFKWRWENAFFRLRLKIWANGKLISMATDLSSFNSIDTWKTNKPTKKPFPSFSVFFSFKSQQMKWCFLLSLDALVGSDGPYYPSTKVTGIRTFNSFSSNH